MTPSFLFSVLVVLLYFLSGMVGLAYQVLWAKMLALQFGISIFGVVITASAFMLGLGGGALLGQRLSLRLNSPLIAFAVLELLVALYALSLPSLSQWIDLGVSGLGQVSLSAWYGYYAVATFFMIVLPALALGLGFPMVLRALRSSQCSLALIYGVNTCGGALGALLPLLLLPMLGWASSLQLVAFIGVFIAFGSYWLSRFQPDIAANINNGKIALISFSSLLAYAGVGAGALMLEIAWTRLFGMLLLRTEYVMAVILCAFLIGIGIGSLLARYFKSAWWYDLLPVMTALFAVFSLFSVGPIASWAEAAVFSSLTTAMLAQGSAVALVSLPVTILLGAWLPLLNRRLKGDKSSGASLYGANSIGAAVGALLAGFVLLPWLGTMGTIITAAFLLFFSGMFWARRVAWLALPLLAGWAWAGHGLPSIDVLAPAQQKNSVDLAVHEDGLAITHVVEQSNGQRLLLADLQRMDASSDPAAVMAQKNQVRLPLLLHPDPHSILFLGLGTGISASASLSITNIERTAVELSQGAINASGEWFASVNGDVNQKMTVIRDDARRFLRQTDDSYDVIVGDLFHPDFVGRSALLSVEQFKRGYEKLNQGGVFVQWLAVNQFDITSLEIVLRSFQQQFANSYLFVDGFRLALVGLKGEALSVERTLSLAGALDDMSLADLTGAEGPWSWLGRYWGPLQSSPGPIQSEWAPIIEYGLPKLRYGGGLDMVASLSWLLSIRPTVDEAASSLNVAEKDRALFERGFIASDLALRSWQAQFSGDLNQAQRLLRMAYQANPEDAWVSGALADQMFAVKDEMVKQGMARRDVLQGILKIYPTHVGAIKALWQLELIAGNNEQATFYRQQLGKISPLDSSIR